MGPSKLSRFATAVVITVELVGCHAILPRCCCVDL